MNRIEKVQQIKGRSNWKSHFNKHPNQIRKLKLIFTVENVLSDAKGANVLFSRYENSTLVTHI